MTWLQIYFNKDLKLVTYSAFSMMSLWTFQRPKSVHLVLFATVLLTVLTQAESYRSGIPTSDMRARRKAEKPKQVYLFLKLWSPPLLQYHEDLPEPPPPPKERIQVSPYAFYHAYGKRSHGCRHQKHPEPDERFRDLARRIKSPLGSENYVEEEVSSEW